MDKIKFGSEGLRVVRCPECKREVWVSKKGKIIKHPDIRVKTGKFNERPKLCQGSGQEC